MGTFGGFYHNKEEKNLNAHNYNDPYFYMVSIA